MPKLSIIVPVYNVEKYIRQCLESIRNQTFKDFEVLMIDDGSPDGSGAICDEYAKMDLRFKVFHKENGGLSSARNLGLNNAKGEWITFPDSDDYLFSNEVYQEIFNEDLDDIDVIRYCMSINGKTQFLLPEQVKTKKAKAKEIFENFTSYRSVNDCIIRREVIANERFEKISPFEDGLFLRSVLISLINPNVLIINKPVYSYRHLDGSLSKKYQPKIFEYLFFINDKLSSLFVNSSHYNKDAYDLFIVESFDYALKNLLQSEDDEFVASQIKKYAYELNLNDSLKLKYIFTGKQIYFLRLFLKLKAYKSLVKFYRKKHK